MKSLAISILALSLYLIAGCTGSSHSSSTQPVIPQSSELNTPLANEIKAIVQNIESVEISKYRSDSKKAQPELINVVSESSDIQKVTGWIATIKDREVRLPNKIESIYLLQIRHTDIPQITVNRIAYAKDAQLNVYVKILPENTDFYLDTFNETDMQSLMMKLNVSGWHEADRLPLIDP